MKKSKAGRDIESSRIGLEIWSGKLIGEGLAKKMTFGEIFESEGGNPVDVGGKSYPGIGEKKDPKRENSKEARVFGEKENNGESSKKWIKEMTGDHIMKALQITVRILLFTLKWELIGRF